MRKVLTFDTICHLFPGELSSSLFLDCDVLNQPEIVFSEGTDYNFFPLINYTLMVHHSFLHRIYIETELIGNNCRY